MASSGPHVTDTANSGFPRQEPFLRLQSVMIYVRNLDRSLEFYLDLLGFQIVFDGRSQPGKTGQPWVVVSPPDGTANLTLIVPRTESEQFKQIGRATHVTFVTEDVLAKFREWSKRGVHFLSNPRLRRFKPALQLKPALPTIMRRLFGEPSSAAFGIPTATHFRLSALMKSLTP